MELRHLRYFVAVAEEGSVTRAAQRLGLQQPPLSQQLRALEREIGVPLFNREPRRVVLNEAGRLFLRSARAILGQAQEGVEEVRRFHRGEEGRVAIGFTSSASLHPLAPRLIRAFRDRYPLVRFEVEESETYALLLALEEHRIDVALLRIPVARIPHLSSHTLASDGLIAALPRAHPLAAEEAPLDLSALAGEPFILYRRTDGPGIYDALLGGLQRAGFVPRVVDEVSRIIAAINLVAAGRGVTIVPASMRVLHRDVVAYRPLAPGPLPPLPLNLVHNRANRSPAVANFIEAALAVAGEG
ncbi:LysR substrate-binding domain-containing protein [Muricoccus aerilatus]|uniref:LysR substrate-binding domain-containing protein n=1 Tax=Muricoccus aerilatus TaxID=452982 RepID=UPI0005C25315|nr:LysR substrate-binding domain-containing protein [Roseomonas aerilata]